MAAAVSPRRARGRFATRRRPRSGSGRLKACAEREDPYESRADAVKRWLAAESTHAGGSDGFRSQLGRGAASAVQAVYPADTRVLVLCGTTPLGDVGLHLAGALALSGYETTAYYASEDLPTPLMTTGASHINFAPSTAEYYFDLCVDAVLGIGYAGEDIVHDPALEMAIETRLPVASVDVPSGWDVDMGPREIDVRRDEFVQPRLLVSLGRPKMCAKRFAGALHYVYDWEKEGETAEVFASNARAFQGMTGEVYGRPGMFEATLFTKREGRREWVYTEDDDDLWDELD